MNLHRLLVLLCLACCSTLSAVDGPKTNAGPRDDFGLNQIADAKKKSAQFQLRRKQFTHTAHYEQDAAQVLATITNSFKQAETLYTSLDSMPADSDEWDNTWDQAETLFDTIYEQSDDAYDLYAYSNSGAGILDYNIRCLLRLNYVYKAADRLIDCWYRYPDYASIDDLFSFVLAEAEALQNYDDAINLQAGNPNEVLQGDWDGELDRANMLFYMLAEHGDYYNIAPRASLGLARSLLIRGRSNRDKLLAAQFAFSNFLNTFPRSNLAFTALCEQALSHLLQTYAGRYDAGVLNKGSTFIDQAELYVADSEERKHIIRTYRALIIRWKQDKDFQTAQWYDNKGHLSSAAYYYKTAIAFDTTTENARASRRALERIQPLLDAEATKATNNVVQ